MSANEPKVRDRIICWLKGHVPDLEKCRKVVLPSRIQDCGLVVIHHIGRTIYYGTTTCKRCGKELHGDF